MKGYTTTETSTQHAPEVVEDKVVVSFDPDEKAWQVSRTTVTRRTTETTERHTSAKTWPSYVAAATVAEEHSLPVYLPSDDRHRAETELAEAADAAADAAAVTEARRNRNAASTLAKEK